MMMMMMEKIDVGDENRKLLELSFFPCAINQRAKRGRQNNRESLELLTTVVGIIEIYCGKHNIDFNLSLNLYVTFSFSSVACVACGSPINLVRPKTKTRNSIKKNPTALRRSNQ